MVCYGDSLIIAGGINQRTYDGRIRKFRLPLGRLLSEGTSRRAPCDVDLIEVQGGTYLVCSHG